MVEWTRDMRCCVIDNLRLPDIIRLAFTCAKWAEVMQDTRYNQYWRTRYKRDFIEYPLTAKLPASSMCKKKKPVLWFDVYDTSIFVFS